VGGFGVAAVFFFLAGVVLLTIGLEMGGTTGLGLPLRTTRWRATLLMPNAEPRDLLTVLLATDGAAAATLLGNASMLT
jgi:hypothetical protein